MLAATLSLIVTTVPAPGVPNNPVIGFAVTPPRSPRPLQSLISPDDYPAGAPRARPQEPLGVVLDVTPEGRVSGCKVLRSSGSAIVDASTCEILQRRARFIPARDNRTGLAVAGQVADVIRWAPAPGR